VDKLKNKLADVQYIAPRKVRGLWGGTPPSLVKGQKSGQYIVYGDYPVVIKIAAKKIYQGGRFINDEDIRQARKVCVIGERTQKDLFAPDENPVGQYVKIDSSYFKVIGVHKYTEGGGMETDGDVYIPFTTYQKLYNSGQSVDWLAIAAFDDVDIVDLEAQVKTQLKQAHRVAPEDERAIVSFNLGVMFDKITGFSKGMNFLSIVVGVATILAGVVGIGNILLISVKERTQELGIRRALGATPGEIRGLILLESVFLTLSAGVTGIVLGAGVLALLALATEGIDFPYQNPTVPLSYVFGSLVIMTVLSTLIGLIPAQRAISIRPIDALRDE
jgi:putative ABC transport system permease protein